MGGAGSVPAASEFEQHHEVDPKIPSLGEHHGAAPSMQSPIKLIVREKLFSWSGDSFTIMTKEGSPFGNDLNVKGNALSFRDEMTLLDGRTGEPVAVCLRTFELVGQTFRIYSTRPLYPGQTPSGLKYNQDTLYTFARVECIPFTIEQAVTFDNESSPSYTVRRIGSPLPKKRLVKRHEHPAALMEGGTWQGNWNSYLLTISPGIDPCLMVCLSAICDEMDEVRR